MKEILSPSELAESAIKTLTRDPEGNNTEVLINILITERCNFECLHCLNRSGPKAPAGSMTWEDMEDILSFAQLLGMERVRWNIVGGEPTINLRALDMILRCLGHTAQSIEMTSNGWWLRDFIPFRNVMRVLTPWLSSGALHLRISDSRFHDPFRKEEAALINGKGGYRHDLQGWLDLLMEKAIRHDLKNGLQALCLECDEALDTKDLLEEDVTCKACGEVSYLRAHEGYSPSASALNWPCASLLEAEKEGHFHIDHQSVEGVTCTGRAADNSIGHKGGSCGWDEECTKYTFKPGAQVHDFCCFGGPSYAGHARDGLKLVLRRILLMKHLENAHPDKDRYCESVAFDRCVSCPTISRGLFDKRSRQHKLVDDAFRLLEQMMEERELSLNA